MNTQPKSGLTTSKSKTYLINHFLVDIIVFDQRYQMINLEVSPVFREKAS